MSRTRVLVIDDDDAVRLLMVEALREAGYDVLEASNGAQGLARAATFQPAVVVVDLVMPQMNGYTFAQAMRYARPGVRLPPARIIATSAVTRQIPPGADDFLPKPFMIEQLVELVRHHAAAAA